MDFKLPQPLADPRLVDAAERIADALENQNFFTLMAMGFINVSTPAGMAFKERTALAVAERAEIQHKRQHEAREAKKAKPS